MAKIVVTFNLKSNFKGTRNGTCTYCLLDARVDKYSRCEMCQ
jgi:hypothetical protein